MVNHFSKLRGLQKELHAMKNLVADEDFIMILITLLLESWDNYTELFLGSSRNKPIVVSYELIAVLHQRRKGQNGEGSTALLSKGKDKQGANKDKECYNCKKKGHIMADCWGKGGGKEGQGPKGRKEKKNWSNQAEDINSSLNAFYMAGTSQEISEYDWLLNSGTTSHICTIRDAFAKFPPIKEMLNGVSKKGTPVTGHGTIRIKFEFDRK